VPAKVTKLIGLKNKRRLSAINLVTFAVTSRCVHPNYGISGPIFVIFSNFLDPEFV
jgi:hypothetical protein